jgi:ABC-type uncharacterized transport system permease subunit
MFLLWLRVATVLYAAASLTALPAVLYGRPNWRRFCLPLAVGAIFFHFVSFIEMLAAGHHLMPEGMNEVQSLLGLLISALFLLLWFVYRTFSFGLFALPLTFFLVFVPSLGPDRYTFSSSIVRGGWIFVHIILLLAAIAALIFSLLASLLYLLQERRLKSKHPLQMLTWLPPLETMDQIAYITLVIGFPCMTVGLFIGSLIAQESVGARYFYDPKVIATFVMWVIYCALLLVRRSTGLRGRRAAYFSSAVLFGMVCVWIANLFSHVHRYTAP